MYCNLQHASVQLIKPEGYSYLLTWSYVSVKQDISTLDIINAHIWLLYMDAPNEQRDKVMMINNNEKDNAGDRSDVH